MESDITMNEAERWLAWLDGDRKDDGTRQMVGTPYQAAQRIAARLYEAEADDDNGWRDYDHGFRDGYQAALREGPDALLQAARWVVENWDREATQHASMAALRQAVQRRQEGEAAA